MKHVIPLILLLFAILGYAVAEDAFTAISIDDLRANPSLLETHRYVSTGQPDEDLLVQVKSAGYAAVIDLRTAAEDRGMDEPVVVEGAGTNVLLTANCRWEGSNLRQRTGTGCVTSRDRRTCIPTLSLWQSCGRPIGA